VSVAEGFARSALVGPLLLLAVCGGAAWWQRDLAAGVFPVTSCPAGTEPLVGRATLELPPEAVEMWDEAAKIPTYPTYGFCRARGVVRGQGDEPNTIEEWQTPDDLPVRLADGRLVHAPRATWSPFRGRPIDNERARLYRAGSSFRSSDLEEECLPPTRPLDLDGCLAPDGALRGRTGGGPVFYPDGRHTTHAAFWGGLLALALALAGVIYAGEARPRGTVRPRRTGLALSGAGLVLVLGLVFTGAPWALWLAALALLRLVWQTATGYVPAPTLEAQRLSTAEPVLRGQLETDLETRQREAASSQGFVVEDAVYTLRQEDLASGAPALHTLPDGPLFVTGAALGASPGAYRADGRPVLGRLDSGRPLEVFDLDPRPPRRAELALLLRHRAKTRALAAFAVAAAGGLVTLLVRLAG